MTTETISDDIRSHAKIGAALAKAQGKIKNASKDGTNPGFKRDGEASKYATLSSVWDACRSALSENEIAVIQSPEVDAGMMVLRTMLLHSSGEKLSGVLPISVANNATAQQVGSAITYARRYSLAAMVGVAPDDDDDGNAATSTGPVSTAPSRTPAQPKVQAGDFWTKPKLAIPFPAAHVPNEAGLYSSDALEIWGKHFATAIDKAPSRELLARLQTDNQHILDQLEPTKTFELNEACAKRAASFKP